MARVATGVKAKIGALWEAAAAGTPDIGVLLLISAGLQDEDTLADHDTVAALLAATNDEATFTGYVRKTVAPAITRDDAADTQTLTLAGSPPLVVEWTAAGGAGGAGTNNVLGRMVYYYDPTPGSSTDAQKIHLASTPVNAVTDGSTLRVTIPASGIATYRDGSSAQAAVAAAGGGALSAGSVFDVHVNSAAAINADKLADGTVRKLLTDGSVTNAKVAASAAITLDKTTDSATRLALSASERKKLAGVDEGDLIQRVGVPLYIYPDWFGSPPRVYDQIMDNAPTVKYLIVNPDTGPGAALNTDYQQQIKLAQASGVRVLGYVSTSYGSVASATILSDVTKWRTWYAPDGIFLDETNYDGTNETHYRSVYQGIKAQQPNLIVVANPGLGVVASMSDTADIFMSFEGVPADYRARATTNAPAWERLAPASKQWHLIHSVASLAEAREMLDISRTYRAGTVFVTDRTMPNPWLGLPTNTAIWQAQLNQCSGGEQAVDATAAALAAGTHTGISFTYDDPGGSISATASGGGTPADGSVTNVKVATAAAINLDKTADSATRLAMTATERTKLTGVATGATANATDAQLRDRSTHTGTQAWGTITGADEAVDDRVNALVVAGTNITKTYDDAAGTLTIAASGASGATLGGNNVFTGTNQFSNLFGVGNPAQARQPITMKANLAAAAMTGTVDKIGMALATNITGNFTGATGSNPGFVWGINNFVTLGSTAGDGNGLTDVVGALDEVSVMTPTGTTHPHVIAGMAEAAFFGAAAGCTVTIMESFRVGAPKRKDGATAGTATNVYGLFIESCDQAVNDVGASSAFALFVEGGLSRIQGRIDIDGTLLSYNASLLLRGDYSGAGTIQLTTNNIGFFGVTPVARQTLPASGSVTAANIRTALINLGLCQ